MSKSLLDLGVLRPLFPSVKAFEAMVSTYTGHALCETGESFRGGVAWLVRKHHLLWLFRRAYPDQDITFEWLLKKAANTGLSQLQDQPLYVIDYGKGGLAFAKDGGAPVQYIVTTDNTSFFCVLKSGKPVWFLKSDVSNIGDVPRMRWESPMDGTSEYILQITWKGPAVAGQIRAMVAKITYQSFTHTYRTVRGYWKWNSWPLPEIVCTPLQVQVRDEKGEILWFTRK